ncbi:Ser/Thr protein kinase RdoA involved in Cpx stress response, MazF antagonist [Actinacidiphila guanduensis]|uniref:Ser/Thr protein kinase RdoA involved in Cpx stress response, MazF antagonist n=1 Tax=Actinacidiphila guanduensis TaxID=310781 RepID=A0A1G9XE03_9ACTN|nr:phosphotransferase [Actinacidiphila guanduensis]SDM94696.1 Ser/Thr protein kinase RdoA involved in Cpx stress response, MazF antagonist [Actinacidiphila guanduensis]
MTGTAPRPPALTALLRRYDFGTPQTCERVPRGLLNRGWMISTGKGRFFLKEYLAADTADPGVILRQHRATRRLARLGLPAEAPLPTTDGETVVVAGGRGHALFRWVEGRHREGTELSVGQSRRLGALLGRVHTALADVQPPPPASDHPSADPERTHTHIDRLLTLVRGHRPRDAFDALAEQRLLERRTLLRQYAHRRPPAAAGQVSGWVHGDFHPLNLLYRGEEPAAIVDWDRLGVRPRAEEAVRAAVIFFVHPVDGSLDLRKVRAYARAYREAAGIAAGEMAGAVHRVWWERLNDFWMLDWRYRHRDRRSDPLFPAAAALAVWWTHEYGRVREAFTG